MSVRNVFVVECDGASCDARLEAPDSVFDSEDEAANWASQDGWLTFRSETARLAYCPSCEPPRALYGHAGANNNGRGGRC